MNVLNSADKDLARAISTEGFRDSAKSHVKSLFRGNKKTKQDMSVSILKNEIVDKSTSRNRLIMQELHDYMKESNCEMMQYLILKDEYEGFLISRTDNAHKQVSIAIEAGFDPDEIKNSILYIGIENAYREYVESLLFEVPELQILQNSCKYEMIIDDLTRNSLDIFYKYLSVPFVEVQEELEKELISGIKEEVLSYV